MPRCRVRRKFRASGVCARLPPRPAEQDEACDEADSSRDRPERAAGHRRSLDQVGSLFDPDDTRQAEQSSHNTPEDDYEGQYAWPRTPVSASRTSTTSCAAASASAWPVTAPMKSARSSAYRRVWIAAVTVAVRGTSRMSAISPK